MGKPKVERRVLGVVSVDSGILVIGDPLYLLRGEDEGRRGIAYESVLEGLSDDHGVQLAGKAIVQLQNFGGDGDFEVMGEFEDGYLVRAVVDFEPVGG